MICRRRQIAGLVVGTLTLLFDPAPSLMLSVEMGTALEPSARAVVVQEACPWLRAMNRLEALPMPWTIRFLKPTSDGGWAPEPGWDQTGWLESCP